MKISHFAYFLFCALLLSIFLLSHIAQKCDERQQNAMRSEQSSEKQHSNRQPHGWQERDRHYHSQGKLQTKNRPSLLPVDDSVEPSSSLHNLIARGQLTLKARQQTSQEPNLFPIDARPNSNPTTVRRASSLDSSGVEARFVQHSEPVPTLRMQNLDRTLQAISSEQLFSDENSIPIFWSLDDLIHATLHYSYEIKALRIEPIQRYQDIGALFGRFDTALFLQKRLGESNTPVGNNFEADGVARIRSEDQRVEYGIRKELSHGGSIQLSDITTFRDDNSGVLNPRDQFRSGLNLSLRKELLRGSGRAVAMNEVLVAYCNVDSQTFQSTAAIAQRLSQVITVYWDLVAARARYVAIQESTSLARQVIADLEARSNIDADTNLIEQARVALTQQQVLLNTTKTDIARLQHTIVRLTNSPELANQSQRIEFVPVAELRKEPYEIDVFSRIEQAVSLRPEVNAALQDIKASSIRYHFATNQLLPKLTLLIESSFNGLAGARDLAGAWRDRFDSDPGYQIGFDFELPFRNRQSRYRQRQAALEMTRLSLKLQDTIEGVKNDVLQANENLMLNQKGIGQQQDIFEASMKRLNFLELRQFRIPQESAIPSLQLGQLLSVQSDISAAKSNFVAAIAEREKSVIQLNLASGLLVSTPALSGQNMPRNSAIVVCRQLHENSAEFESQAQAVARQLRQHD